MRLRIMDPSTGDMTFGRGARNFYVDQPEAVAQLALTRLKLQEADWFLDLAEGTPYRTKVLGNRTDGRDMVMQARARRTQGVRSITSYASQVDRQTRQFSVQIGLDTVYGPVSFAGLAGGLPPATFQIGFAQ